MNLSVPTLGLRRILQSAVGLGIGVFGTGLVRLSCSISRMAVVKVALASGYLP